MDWPGQKSEQNALQCCLVGAATAATITWLLFQSTKAMLATYLVGVIVTFLVAVPDWDFFRRPPGDWHDVVFVDAPAHVVREIAEQRDRKWHTKISAVNAGPGTIAFDDKKLTSNHHQR